MKTKNLRKENAITLVALIITIIVLLILAMVSIALVMNSGIINKSKSAVDKYSQEEIQEQIKLAYSEWQMGQYTGVTEDAPTFIKNKLNSVFGPGTVANVTAENGILTVELTNGKTYTYNVATGVAAKVKTVAEYPEATPGKVNKNENTKYTSDGKTAVIPAGYTVDATQNSIDNGLVISKDGNEWVWIPVSSADLALMYTEDTTGWTMFGTSGENAVVTKYKSNSRTEIRSDLTRVNPGTTTGYREPDTVVGNGSKYDAAQEYRSAAEFTTLVDMATKLRDDYKNMIDSVRKNGGFYVGRYELSEAGTKKDQPSLTNTNWYNLYAACKNIDNTNTSIETRMIWGCQWDQVCKFISTSGDQVSLTDSSTYGNYTTYDENWNVVHQGEKANTGSNDTWKANNIYDIAGNCWEWTQEAKDTYSRANRGGVYDNNGADVPVTYRASGSPAYSDYDGNMSSRPVLYIK